MKKQKIQIQNFEFAMSKIVKRGDVLSTEPKMNYNSRGIMRLRELIDRNVFKNTDLEYWENLADHKANFNMKYVGAVCELKQALTKLFPPETS